MRTATQIRAEHPTKPASSPSGSEATEQGFELAEVLPEPGIHPQAAWKILQARRSIMERTFNARKNRATRLRHEAESEQCYARLFADQAGKTGDASLTTSQKKDILGRAEEAKARAELCVETVLQYELEIEALKTGLSDRPGAGLVRFRRWLSLKLWV